jgi:hypothetical protein
MNARGTAGRLLVGLAVLALLGGCAAGGSPTPPSTSSTLTSTPSAAVSTPSAPTPVATPKPSPTPSPTPTAVAFGPVTVVTGTNTCPSLNPVWTTDPNGTQHVRGLAVECTDTTDDPRVSGTHTASWSADLWGDAAQGVGTLVQWGTVRLANAGGAWEGRLSGVASLPGRGDSIAILYKGTGGYAGLAYFELLTGSDPWKIQGQIIQGDPPPPYAEAPTGTGRPEAGGPVADKAVAVVTGTATCPGMTWDWTTDPNGTQHVRDGHSPSGCTVTTDDPRVTGHRTSTWNMDLWGDAATGAGALVEWGTPRLENAGGAWEGRATGVASLPGRGDTQVNWYKGTGGYAGLSYFELWTGQDPWTIQGQIFPGNPPTP